MFSSVSIQAISFFGHLKVRRADGALMTASVSPFQSSLTTCQEKAMGGSSSIVSFVKSDPLRAALAGGAIGGCI